jgi:hypothetical protein
MTLVVDIVSPNWSAKVKIDAEELIQCKVSAKTS